MHGSTTEIGRIGGMLSGVDIDVDQDARGLFALQIFTICVIVARDSAHLTPDLETSPSLVRTLRSRVSTPLGARIFFHQLKGPIMKNTFAVAGWIALGAVSSPAPVWCADTAPDTAQVRQQAVVIPSLQQAAANAAGYKPAEVEVKSMAHQITITVVNSKLNSGVAGDRRAEASRIVPAIEKAIVGKSEFGQVMMIHVDYVARQGNRSKIIQGFDFNKTPAGAFVLHQT